MFYFKSYFLLSEGNRNLSGTTSLIKSTLSHMGIGTQIMIHELFISFNY